MAHLLIISASYYRDLADEMIAGASAACKAAGAGFELAEVPGALEIPPAIAYAMASQKFDGYVALGCVLRGETYHFEVVANESARGITKLTVDERAAIGNGILTCDTEEQAWARASRTEGNKGRDAVNACLSLIELKKRFQP